MCITTCAKGWTKQVAAQLPKICDRVGLEELALDMVLTAFGRPIFFEHEPAAPHSRGTPAADTAPADAASTAAKLLPLAVTTDINVAFFYYCCCQHRSRAAHATASATSLLSPRIPSWMPL